MDNVPNEVLWMIVRCLDVQDLLKSRLVSSRWCDAATNHLRRIITITFENSKQIQTFNQHFPSSSMRLPYAKFSFRLDAMKDPSRVARSAIMDFGERHGEAVTGLVLDLCPHPLTGMFLRDVDAAYEYPIRVVPYMQSLERNVLLLLNCMGNLENLDVRSRFELGAIEMPTFSKLRTLKLCNTFQYQCVKPNSESFHTKISQRIPRVESISISDRNFDHLMTFLRNVSETSPRATVELLVNLPMKKPNKLEEFLVIPSPPITTLKISLGNPTGQMSQGEYDRQLCRFVKAQATSLRKLTLDCEGLGFQHRQEVTELPLLPALLELVLHFGHNFPPFTSTHFPQLRKLTVPLKAVCAFTGITLLELKELSLTGSYLHLEKADSEFDLGMVELMFPNVEDLAIVGYAIRSAFKFPNLRRLRISELRHSEGLTWNIFTGKDRFDGDVCTVPIPETVVDEPEEDVIEGRNYSVEDLKRLEILEIEKFDDATVRLLIYISRTKQLRRLKKLHLFVHPLDCECDTAVQPHFLEELKLHHDQLKVSIPK